MRHLLFINSFENDTAKSLLYAAEFAKYINAQLHILHLVSNNLGPFLFTSSQYLISDNIQNYLEELDKNQISKIQEIQTKVQLMAGESLPIDVNINRVSRQEVIEGILSFIKEVDIEMIIVGNNLASQNSNKEMLQRIINHYDIPLLLIPSFQRFASLKGSLFLSEFLYEDIGHIDTVKKWFENKKIEMTVVHFNNDKDIEDEKVTVRQMLKKMNAKDPNHKFILEEIDEDYAIDVYLDLEFKVFLNNFDLLILTTAKRNFWQKIVSKNTSFKIAEKMPVPVLIFRKHD